MICLRYEVTITDLATKQERTIADDYLIDSRAGELEHRLELKRRFLYQVGAMLATSAGFEGSQVAIGKVNVTWEREQATWERNLQTRRP